MRFCASRVKVTPLPLECVMPPAVTVSVLKLTPAVAEAGAVRVSVAAPAGLTVIVPVVPVIEPVTVSVAVIVREPAWVSRLGNVRVD